MYTDYGCQHCYPLYSSSIWYVSSIDIINKCFSCFWKFNEIIFNQFENVRMWLKVMCVSECLECYLINEKYLSDNSDRCILLTSFFVADLREQIDVTFIFAEAFYYFNYLNNFFQLLGFLKWTRATNIVELNTKQFRKSVVDRERESHITRVTSMFF